MTVTLETLKGWHLRQDCGHINAGRWISRVLHRAIEEPRLSRLDSRWAGPEARKREKASLPLTETEWWVDGAPCPSLEDAIERLNKPVELTPLEAEVLARLPLEFEHIRKVQADITGILEEEALTCLNDHPRYRDVTHALMALREKGLAEHGRAPVEREDGDARARTMPTIRRKA